MRVDLYWIILSVLALGPPDFAERFEVPAQGLESRIEFWKKVYTQYGEDDVIIHDRINVNLIYDVATRGEQASKISAVRQAMDEIRANIANPENLTPASQQIRETILANNVPLTASSLADLRDNVHTQIGIKERFRDGIVRSGQYVEAFHRVFDKEGLPADIALLPLVESSFENRA